MSVYSKLLSIQAKLKAPKGHYSDFGGYYYRSCEDIQEALKPLLKEQNVALVLSDELVQAGERYYIKATARLLDCETNEEVSATAYAREELEKKKSDSSQITGATSSYARKYALNGLFCIDDNKDADSKKCDIESLRKQFNEEIKRTGKSWKYFVEKARKETVEDMTGSELEEAINALRSCETVKRGKAQAGKK